MTLQLTPKLVVVESPYAGDIDANVRYARLCMAHSLSLNEAPLASHLLYTQPGILDDSDAQERQQGIAAGLAWAHFADVHAFYLDRGWSRGMLAAHKWCLRHHSLCDYRSLYGRTVGPPDHTLLNAPISEAPGAAPQVCFYTIIEGGKWWPFRPGEETQLHSVLLADGRIYDAANGYRGTNVELLTLLQKEKP